MDLQACIAAASEAIVLLLRFPLQWIGVMLAFLVCVEALMFIPRVGFALKTALASMLLASGMTMFAAAAGGQSPSPLDWFSVFKMPASSQIILAVAGWLPFAGGVLFLRWRAGPGTVRYFFGNILKEKPPASELFLQSKYVMLLLSLPLCLLPGAMVRQSLSGMDALLPAFSAAVINWLPILLMTLIALAIEWAMVKLPSWLPKRVAVALILPLLLLTVAWTFAISYAICLRAFPLV